MGSEVKEQSPGAKIRVKINVEITQGFNLYASSTVKGTLGLLKPMHTEPSSVVREEHGWASHTGSKGRERLDT